MRGPNHLIHAVRWKCWLHACALSHFDHLQLCPTPWTVAHHALLSIGFSRQEHWSGLPCPPPGHLPHPGIEPMSLMSPALASRLFTTCTTGKAPRNVGYTDAIGMWCSGMRLSLETDVLDSSV